jgi:Zn-dependent M28 family amino/carboxypeptidase
MSLPCIGLPYSPSTPKEGLEGEFLSVGDGTHNEYELLKNEISGKIVMTTSRTPPYHKRWIHRCEKLGRAIQHGAKAFIFMNHFAGLGEVTGGARLGAFEGLGTLCDVPTIGISKETGSTLLRLQRDGVVKVKITSNHEAKPNTSWNVVAEIRGIKKPEEKIIIGAHFDGHDISQGAMDDAAGACVVIEAARAMAKYKDECSRTVKFIAFPLEEPGLFGSIAYVNAHKDEMKNIKFMLNLDGAGRAQRPGIMLQGFPELVPFFKNLGKEMKTRLPVGDSLSLYSDYLPYFLRGVPSANLASGSSFEQARTGRGYGHTKWDTIDKVDLRDMQEASATVTRIIWRLANMDDVPFEHKSLDEIRNILKESGYDETLRLEQRYPEFLK